MSIDHDEGAPSSKLKAGPPAAVPTLCMARVDRGPRELIPTLVVVDGKDLLAFKTVPFGSEVVIGRTSDADLVLDRASVSRHHAVVKHASRGKLTVQDLHSTNGVLVNGHPITRAPIRTGDSLDIGEVCIRLDLLGQDELGHLERVQAKLREAGRDQLTGLHNRQWLDDQLPKVAARLEDNDRDFSVVFVDLDHFKDVNDTHGHSVGDDVLRTTSRLIMLDVRDHDEVVRFGGEEILIFMPRTTAEHAKDIAERIRKSVRRHEWERTAESLRVTLSAGIAERRPGESIRGWIDRADRALYAAKADGRDQVAIASELQDR